MCLHVVVVVVAVVAVVIVAVVVVLTETQGGREDSVFMSEQNEAVADLKVQSLILEVPPFDCG